VSKWYLYILECADKTLYTGITNDLSARFARHKSGDGAKYTRRGVKKIVYSERFRTMSAAMRREHEIKSWNREKKLKLIKKLATFLPCCR
jgi:putative endonuclease